jgi:hypothetical protein
MPEYLLSEQRSPDRERARLKLLEDAENTVTRPTICVVHARRAIGG